MTVEPVRVGLRNNLETYTPCMEFPPRPDPRRVELLGQAILGGVFVSKTQCIEYLCPRMLVEEFAGFVFQRGGVAIVETVQDS